MKEEDKTTNPKGKRNILREITRTRPRLGTKTRQSKKQQDTYKGNK